VHPRPPSATSTLAGVRCFGQLPSLRFSPLQCVPTRGSSITVALASHDHLHPQVFSTSRCFDPPRVCWPCFMPDPLLGLLPSEPCSSRAAVRHSGRRSPPGVARSRSDDHGHTRLQGFAPHENPPQANRWLDRLSARSSPGLLSSRVLALTGMLRPSPRLPSWALSAPSEDVAAVPPGCFSGEPGWPLSRLPTLLDFSDLVIFIDVKVALWFGSRLLGFRGASPSPDKSSLNHR
jgi:hypothetical protein